MTSRPATNAKDCEGCPEPRSPRQPETLSEAPGRPLGASGRGWVTWTGGPPEAHLASLASVLPPEMAHVRIHPDGSIEYMEKRPDDWEPPSPIDGYERDAENPKLFRPLWKSCQYRYFSVSVTAACHCLDVIAECGHPETKVIARSIDCQECNLCDLRLPIPEMFKPQKKTLHSKSR